MFTIVWSFGGLKIFKSFKGMCIYLIYKIHFMLLLGLFIMGGDIVVRLIFRSKAFK